MNVIALLELKKRDLTVSSDEMRTIDKVIGWIKEANTKKEKTIRCTGCFSKFTAVETLVRHIIRYHEVVKGEDVWISDKDKTEFTDRFK